MIPSPSNHESHLKGEDQYYPQSLSMQVIIG